MDALANALADADRMFHHASKAVTNVRPMLTGNLPTNVAQSGSLSKALEQYQHNRGWVFVAVKTIASKIAGQDIFVGRIVEAPKRRSKLDLPQHLKSIGQKVDPLESHPLLDAVCCPNPLMTRWPLMFSTVSSLLLTGRSYWWLVETKDGLQVWPVPAHWIEPGDVMRGTWKLRPFGGTTSYDIPGEDVCPFIYPNPCNPFGSVSPLQSQALAVNTDEQIQAAQSQAFAQGIHPGLMIRVGRLPGMMEGQRPVLEGHQRLEIIDAVLKLYGGTANRNNPLIVDGLIEGVEKITNGPAEMDFLDSGSQTKSRILQAFGVNPVVAGELEGANRASSAVAAQHFAESTCNPLIELVSQSLTRWVGQRFAGNKEKLVAWIEPCRANDPEQRLAEWKAARAVGDVSTNEYRTNILNLPAIAGGDEYRDQLGNSVTPTN